ncbi:hypothetical protein [Robertkochia aurantiaca]|uniref:hypothetical protein n=1 Tax=Robertkochia aurantiaca TaxID=2873700 RepID=UPI001CCCFA98|nr:hypothetical protein [Robertkochia sp. 3YJGBD-33]
MDKSIENSDQKAFEKKVLSAIPHVVPYVKHRIYRAEATGIIPRNMYKSNGVIDDAIVKLYEDASTRELDSSRLRLRLFSYVDKELDDLYEKESFHRDSMSTSRILENELDLLEERFASELDEDLVMLDELDDISYHQDDFKKTAFVYEDAEQNIIQSLGLQDIQHKLDKNKRLVLNKIYHWLPFHSSNVLDLYMFGKMSTEEIAKVKNVEIVRVERILDAVKKSFRKNLV